MVHHYPTGWKPGSLGIRTRSECRSAAQGVQSPGQYPSSPPPKPLVQVLLLNLHQARRPPRSTRMLSPALQSPLELHPHSPSHALTHFLWLGCSQCYTQARLPGKQPTTGLIRAHPARIPTMRTLSCPQLTSFPSYSLNY